MKDLENTKEQLSQIICSLDQNNDVVNALVKQLEYLSANILSTSDNEKVFDFVSVTTYALCNLQKLTKQVSDDLEVLVNDLGEE